MQFQAFGESIKAYVRGDVMHVVNERTGGRMRLDRWTAPRDFEDCQRAKAAVLDISLSGRHAPLVAWLRAILIASDLPPVRVILDTTSRDAPTAFVAAMSIPKDVLADGGNRISYADAWMTFFVREVGYALRASLPIPARMTIIEAESYSARESFEAAALTPSLPTAPVLE